MRPVSGAVRVSGEAPWGNRRLTRVLGYAPESEIGFHGITGREFVRLVLRLKGMKASEAVDRANRILERTQASPFADKRISIMSRGMRQRIKLAAALAHDPQVLILDEPLSGADPIIRAEILKMIREYAIDGRIVVMSTHVLQEIEELTDQIVVLHRGRLLAQGGIHEIRSLIDRHPQEIRIVTSNVRELASQLAKEGEVLSLNLEEAAVVVRTHAPAAFYPKLTRIIADGGIAIRELTSTDDNLEAVFKYLTEK
jgi:ABC-2 type transport system ATP-binding protein